MRGHIVRKKCNPKNYTRKAFGNIADFILFYTKSDQYAWNRPVEPLSEKSTKEYHYTEPDTGRRFMKVPIHAPGIRNGATGGSWRGKMPPPGKHWQYVPQTLDKMDAKGEIFWSKNGNPRRKVYLDTHPGVGIQDIWLDFRDAHNQNIKITGYPTEKNPDLLRRILQASSNPGDLVLDCYVGSGTTLAVANEMQRHWIGMDNSPEAISTIQKRFERGLEPMGDFVKAKSNKANQAYVQPSLFNTIDDAVQVEPSQPVTSQTPIENFSIYLQKDVHPEIRLIAEKWMRRKEYSKGIDQNNTLAVSEGVNMAEVCYQLHACDKRLSRIIEAVGPCALMCRRAGFDFLVDAIIGQQLSKRAADTITHRFRSVFSASRPTPKKFITTRREKILKAGISARKYEYILDLAQRIDNKQLNLSCLVHEDDATIRKALKQVKGIGDWTVDMYLLFGLARLDVFPVNDLALRKSMSAVYDVDVSDVRVIERIANKWQPYRSVGAWYLYKNANARA
jgi:3-methyladenine DNA glycosylase/8-oxoguanine DNA glycosylase